MPIGPFVADFACPTRRLIIEVDGRTHAERPADDARRDAWFRREGWRVLRFSDDRVIGGLPLVVDAIAAALRAP
ncbi:endonuclease domain-containing protein [Labrys wisconsinensis]|uniref:Very-short-patch-repair endonuclease n=1 Tax=Labrys wisconsinensis TaxID=425677 RepID=A0ABU0JF09_9HYPH|nr:very-short-patch-repair endonuclease [Labrys wisconsinensis]